MSEHLRALIVILGLAMPTLWIAQRVLCPVVMDTVDFARRRNVWLGITLAAFLSHNYWLYLGIASVFVLWGANPRKERNPMALFFFLLFAAPAFQGALPGLGVFQHLFQVNHLRFLAVLVLIPAAFRLRGDPSAPRLGHFAADWFLLAYLALQVVLIFEATTTTQTMRATFYLLVDVLFIYYVASRSVVDLRGFRDVAASLGVALLMVAPIAVFEFMKHWLLYSSLSAALGLTWDAGLYLSREAFLRAVGPAGHSLVLGYAMAVGLGLWLCLYRTLNRTAWWVGVFTLFAGLVAPVSRGPWVGAAAIVFVAAASGRTAGQRTGKLLMVSIGVLTVLALTPYGTKLVEYLPFVGSVDQDNVSYRSRLFDVSLMVIAQNPLFGAPSFLSNPAMEQMRQGQGIIDLVNSYLAIALSFGLVGLALFASIFLSNLLGVYKAMRIGGRISDDAELVGRALLSVLVGVLVMIATVSSILAIPTIYWALSGLAVAYTSMVASLVVTPSTTPRASRSSRLAETSRSFSHRAACRRPQSKT